MNYVICWSVDKRYWRSSLFGIVGRSVENKFWEVISGEDAMQIRVSELVESGVLIEDIVVGEIGVDQ